MKYLLLVFFNIILLLSSCSNQQVEENKNLIKFECADLDLGDVKQDEIVECSFIYRNTGDDTIYIQDVLFSCSCTSMGDFKKSLEPGATDTLKVSLDTFGKPLGSFKEEVRVIANTKPDYYRLSIFGEIN
ncbi:MAG: DUF1573 domain-containing protein [Bacteroidales bacterium]